MRVFAGLMLALMTVGAWAQGPDPAHVEALCKQAEHVVLAKLPVLSAGEKLRLSKCDPAGLYYGLPHAPNYAAARRCALVLLSDPTQVEDDDGPVFAMATMAMIYANGDGVPRNVGAAMKFVCTHEPENDYARGRIIEELAKLKKGPAQRYDFCATAGYDFRKIVEMECTAIELGLKDKERDRSIARVTASWTPEQKAAFVVLRRVHEKFVSASVDAEVEPCITGTADEMLEIADDLHEKFAQDLEGFEQGKLPHFPREYAVGADRNLNAAYRKVVDGLTEQAKAGGDCVKAAAPVRDAERVWIAYRDAWLKFAKLRWAQVSADSWMAFLSNEREERLAQMEF